MIHYTLKSLVRWCSLGTVISTDTLDASSTTGDVGPCGTKAAACAGEKTFLLFLCKIIIQLLLIETRSTEQHDDKDNEEDAEESELSPEVDDAEEGEINGDAVQERANDGGCADHASDRVVGGFAARTDSLVVVATVGLLIGMVSGSVTVGLGTESGILRGDHHSNGIVDGEDDQSEQDSSHEESLGSGVALANAEQSDPQEANTNGSDTNNRSGEEEESQEEEDDIVDGEDL